MKQIHDSKPLYRLSLGSCRGPDLASEPYVTRFKGTENQSVTGRENEGEAPHNNVHFHPEAEGVARRTDPKEKPFLLGSGTSPRPAGPAQRGVWGEGGRAGSAPSLETYKRK